MDGIYEWGIEAILWLRQSLPGLVPVFEIFTSMGNQMFFLLVLPFIYWCLDRATGARATVVFLLSAYLNAVAKAMVVQPRPFDYALDRLLPLFESSLEQVQERYEASGGGFPSGHTQNAVVLWGYLATQFKRTWFWIVAGLLMFLIPLSRIYLAVHFPHDLLGGYVLGVILLLLYLWLNPKVEEWFKDRFAWQLGIVLVVPALMMLLSLDESSITTGATLMGMGAGFVLERRWVGFDSAGVWWKRVLRYLLGACVLVFLYAGLKQIFGDLQPVLLFRFIRYGLIGLWGGLGAPWLFVKVGLAKA